MKFLILLQNIEGSAPGVIYKRIIDQLCEKNEVDILYSGRMDGSSLQHCLKKQKCPYLNLPIRIKIMLQKCLGINPSDILWGCLAPLFIKGHYDVVFNMISMSSYAPLYAGHKIAKRAKAKNAFFSVDAIPAPGWSYDPKVKKAQRNAISLLRHADFFASINPLMLQYQLTTFKPKKGFKSGVFYLPVDSQRHIFERIVEEEVFLYAGRIYADRKINYMMDAFSVFLKSHPKSKFVFVGANINKEELEKKWPEAVNHIELHGFTDDLSPFYEAAKVLVDIDADIENDVFLSSKLLRYLTINRVILCETGENSPSRHMFSGIRSIIQCGHTSESVLQGMNEAVSYNNQDFNDRNGVIEKFSINNMAKQIITSFNEICQTN